MHFPIHKWIHIDTHNKKYSHVWMCCACIGGFRLYTFSHCMCVCVCVVPCTTRKLNYMRYAFVIKRMTYTLESRSATTTTAAIVDAFLLLNCIPCPKLFCIRYDFVDDLEFMRGYSVRAADNDDAGYIS